LKPHQPRLIKWFDKYKVSLTQAELEEDRPDFSVERDDSMSFDPNALSNQNLIADDAEKEPTGSSSDED
jgi:hypothetical protein